MALRSWGWRGHNRSITYKLRNDFYGCMKNPTGTKYGKIKFFTGGGINHVRYDHFSRPAKIEVKCPNCDGLAIAHDKTAKKNSNFVSDMELGWKSNLFYVSCTSCFYRKENTSYENLSEPFHQIRSRGGLLWAWNLSHLEMIYKYLNGQPIQGHPFKFYSTYIHGAWKKNRDAYVTAIDRWLKKNNLVFGQLGN